MLIWDFSNAYFVLTIIRFGTTLYGDEIIWNDWNRSKWKCSKCGKIQLRADLVEGASARPDVQEMIDEYHEKQLTTK